MVFPLSCFRSMALQHTVKVYKSMEQMDVLSFNQNSWKNHTIDNSEA